MRFAATVLTLLSVLSLLSPLAGCARCVNAGGSWSATGALCRHKGQ